MKVKVVNLNKTTLVLTIKFLLGAPKIYKLSSDTEFHIKANRYKVQKEIFSWLSISDRKENFELMTKERPKK